MKKKENEAKIRQTQKLTIISMMTINEKIRKEKMRKN